MMSILVEVPDDRCYRHSGLSTHPCLTCGWAAVAPSARACGRCGAPVTRGRGLNGYDFAAARSGALDPAFATSRPRMADHQLHFALQPMAWSGYGSSVALLAHSGHALTLDQLRASPDAGPTAALDHRRLAENLPDSLLAQLVAPPLAGRIGICLVSTTQIHLYVADDPHLPQFGAKQIWSATDRGERICAAAIDADGDIFVATVADGGPHLTIRRADGAPLATISDLAVAPGAGVGLAVQHPRNGRGAPDDLIIYAWAGGRLARQHAAADPKSVELFSFEGLEAPALSWWSRMDSGSAVPWHGWRCAAAGAYPVETGSGENAAVRGLYLHGEQPKLVVYGRGRHHAIVAESAERYLLAERTALRIVDPRTGHLIAQKHEDVPADSVFAGSGSGGFVCLTPQVNGDVLMRGLGVRGADIVEGFRTTLRNPSSAALRGSDQLVRAVPGLAPVETDDGLLVGLEEGAGDDTSLTLWHGTTAFSSGNVQ